MAASDVINNCLSFPSLITHLLLFFLQYLSFSSCCPCLFISLPFFPHSMPLLLSAASLLSLLILSESNDEAPCRYRRGDLTELPAFVSPPSAVERHTRETRWKIRTGRGSFQRATAPLTFCTLYYQPFLYFLTCSVFTFLNIFVWLIAFFFLSIALFCYLISV